MTRVVSKHLFDFKPAGQMEKEVKALEDQFEEMMKDPEAKKSMDRVKELELKHDHDSNMEFVALTRAALAPFMKFLCENEAAKYGSENTITTFIKAPTSHDGEFDLPIEVYTPKNLEDETKRAAYVYAHGGGAVALSAADVRPLAQCVAVDMNVVVFSVDYRLAPETKCPNNIKDFYEAIKYVSKNADSLGIDPAKIVIAGESGGGYICLGAMVLLAEHGETDLVKLAIPSVPMVDDYCFSDPLSMTVEERQSHMSLRKLWRDLIAADFDSQKDSPHLFPGKASEELLEKFPPTIILEAEFDMFITEATRLAGRLRRAGRLLEFVVIPGGTHSSSYIPGTRGCDIMTDTLKIIAKEYIFS
jgi:acetyl esterase/lipase